MITVTLGDVLGDLDNPPDACIYLIRDGDTVFYVGKSTRGVVNRILAHCGLSTRGSLRDNLGEFIFCNRPDSLTWQADLFTFEDCKPIIAEVFPNQKRIDIDWAELALITRYRPCLNRAGNTDPNLLPARYKHY